MITYLCALCGKLRPKFFSLSVIPVALLSLTGIFFGAMSDVQANPDCCPWAVYSDFDPSTNLPGEAPEGCNENTGVITSGPRRGEAAVTDFVPDLNDPFYRNCDATHPCPGGETCILNNITWGYCEGPACVTDADCPSGFCDSGACYGVDCNTDSDCVDWHDGFPLACANSGTRDICYYASSSSGKGCWALVPQGNDGICFNPGDLVPFLDPNVDPLVGADSGPDCDTGVGFVDYYRVGVNPSDSVFDFYGTCTGTTRQECAFADCPDVSSVGESMPCNDGSFYRSKNSQTSSAYTLENLHGFGGECNPYRYAGGAEMVSGIDINGNPFSNLLTGSCYCPTDPHPISGHVLTGPACNCGDGICQNDKNTFLFQEGGVICVGNGTKRRCFNENADPYDPNGNPGGCPVDCCVDDGVCAPGETLSCADCNFPVDTDGDGVFDCAAGQDPATDGCDNCPENPIPDQTDGDGDGVGDVCDNCLGVINPDQKNTDKLTFDLLVQAENNPASCGGDPVPCDLGSRRIEVDTLGDACDPDDDGDGIPDATEIGGYDVLHIIDPLNGTLGVHGGVTTDPLNYDTDGDGCADGVEWAGPPPLVSVSDPTLPDTDQDGLCDCHRPIVGCFSEDRDMSGSTEPGESDPGLVDSDGDGLTDSQELGKTSPEGPAPYTNAVNFVADSDPSTTTDPNNPDSDGDGIPDGVEDSDQNGRVDAGETNPGDTDSDNDGLPDGLEDPNHNGVVDPGESDPSNSDSDGDGIPDGQDAGPLDSGNTDCTEPYYKDPRTGLCFDDQVNTRCFDGLDNDGDGYTDCGDSACRNAFGSCNACNLTDCNENRKQVGDVCHGPGNLTPGMEGVCYAGAGVSGTCDGDAVFCSCMTGSEFRAPDSLCVGEGDACVVNGHAGACESQNDPSLVGCYSTEGTDVNQASCPCFSTADWAQLVDDGFRPPQPLIPKQTLEACVDAHPPWADDAAPYQFPAYFMETLAQDAVAEFIIDQEANTCSYEVSGNGQDVVVSYQTTEAQEADCLAILISCTLDDDDDGRPNCADNCPTIANGDQLNTDADLEAAYKLLNPATLYQGDGLGDACDDDDDNDGTLDADEIANGRDPLNPDEDGDGICDGHNPLDNPVCQSEDLNNNGVHDPAGGETDPMLPDTDGDGIPDPVELGFTEPQIPGGANFVADADPSTVTDPNNPDTDGDGFTDGEEDANHNGAVDPGEGDPTLTDTDNNGVPDDIDALCPCDGPAGGGKWKNNGQYTNCVAMAANTQVMLGTLSQAQMDIIVAAAAQSSCGDKQKDKDK